MARNRYFNQYSTSSEQTVLEDLIIESMKQYGIDVYYLPKTFVNLDGLYKEDASMMFDDALQLEAYLKTYDGYLGQNDFISKFGLQIDDSMTISIARRRFDQILQPMIMTEYNYNMKLEDGTHLVQENGYDYSQLIRPQEGDLLWFPLSRDLFEIKFVETVEVLYQLGKVYTYELRCDKYEYAGERIDTDVADIDQVENDYSLSTTNMPKMLAEDGTLLLNENGTKIVEEGYHVEEQDDSSQNDYLQTKIAEEDVIDFSESNPFSSVRVF